MSLCINIHYKGMVKDISEIVVIFALIRSQNAFKFYFIYRIPVSNSNGNFKVKHPNTAQFKAGGI